MFDLLLKNAQVVDPLNVINDVCDVAVENGLIAAVGPDLGSSAREVINFTGLVLQPGMITIIFALMLTEWVGMSRIARAEMLKLKDQEFVLASRTLGAGSFFIIFKEVLPNIIGPIITQVMFSIPTAIFTEAFLSFVGLGIPVPQCSLGSLISELYNSFTTHPYQIIPPIVVMSLLMLSFNLLADGLREALDPKMKSM